MGGISSLCITCEEGISSLCITFEEEQLLNSPATSQTAHRVSSLDVLICVSPGGILALAFASSSRAAAGANAMSASAAAPAFHFGATDFIVASTLVTKKKRSFEDAFGDDAALDTVRPEKRARFFTTASPEKVRRIEEREENRTTPCDNRAMRWMVVEGCGRGMMTLQQAENCTEQPTTYGSEKRGATR